MFLCPTVHNCEQQSQQIVELDNNTMSIDEYSDVDDGGYEDGDINKNLDQTERYSVNNSIAQHLAMYVTFTLLLSACDFVCHLKK